MIFYLLYVISWAVRRVKFETILKYHEWYLCQISCTRICALFHKQTYLEFSFICGTDWLTIACVAGYPLSPIPYPFWRLLRRLNLPILPWKMATSLTNWCSSVIPPMIQQSRFFSHLQFVGCNIQLFKLNCDCVPIV